MSRFNNWQSGTATFMALGIIVGAAAPIVAPAEASAQSLFNRQPQQEKLTVPAGVSIPVVYDKAEKIVVTPTETVPLTLTVAANVKTRRGTMLIPAGSQIIGQLQPAEKGSQFVAQEIVINQYQRQYINATSKIITQTQEVRRGTDTGSILKGAAIGTAAAAVLSGVTGDKRITPLEVLAGTGLGAVGGLLLGQKKNDVVVINPNTDLALTLRSDLALR